MSVAVLIFAILPPCVAENINPTNYTRSVVSIFAYFDAEHAKQNPKYDGNLGTAWFLNSDRIIVTATHVIDGTTITSTNWTEVIFRQESVSGEPVRKEANEARLVARLGPPMESASILELKRSFTNAIPLSVNSTPLTKGDSVVSVAYPNKRLRFATGQFLGTVPTNAKEEKLAGLALFELADGNQRDALDHGSSGGPILDKYGQVVGVISALLYIGEISFGDKTVKYTASWGNPNMSAIPTDLSNNFFAPKK